MEKRAALYVRVSTEEQVKSGYSIAEQIHQLETYAKAQELDVVQVITDDGYSGASAERPGLQKIMELAETSRVDLVLSVKRDRLFRSRLYRLLFERDLEEHGVKLTAINDIGHKIGDGLLDDFSEWERDQITERTNAGKRQKAREGKIVAGPKCLHGFRYSESGDSLEVDEAEMVSVRRMFSLVSEGHSVSAVARILTDEGFKKWLRPFVRTAILHDAYRPHSFSEIEALVSPEVSGRLDETRSYGVWWYNTRESYKTRKGKKTRQRPKDEWIAVPVPDSGIPRETVDAARAVLSRNERMPKSTAAGRTWELDGGTLRCAGCDNAMTAVAGSTTHTLKSGERKKYLKYQYRCDTVRRGQECSHPRTISAGKTEALVWDAVKGFVLDPARLRAALQASRKVRPRKVPPDRLRAILASLEELGKRRDGLVSLAADGDIPREELREKLPPLDSRVTALEREAEELRTADKRRKDSEGNVAFVISRMEAAAPDELDSLDSEGRRELYRDLDLKAHLNADGSLELSWSAGPIGYVRRGSDSSCPASTTSPTRG